MKRLFFVIACMSVLAILPAGCSSKENEEKAPVSAMVSETPTPLPTTPTPTPAPTLAPVPELTEDLTGKAKSLLTGKYIDEDIANRRPIAVVINNIQKALPQSGIAQADIYYEVLAEADITRIIAVFQDFEAEKIGPVRSARHYFLDFALDTDAVFLHHGRSEQCYVEIPRLGINNIDGMSDGAAFWRDPVRVSQSGMYEHSSYTNAQRMLATVDSKKYRNTFSDTYESMFDFYDGISFPVNAEMANKVTLYFSQSRSTVFSYDYKTNVYKRFQGGTEHIDDQTGEQLEVTNVIIQFADMYVIAGDEYGRRDVKLVSSGKGILATGGQFVSISWKKDSHASPTQWFDEDGNKLFLNKGKTWICVYQTGAKYEIE